MNGSPIIEAGFLQPLVNLLALKDNEIIQLDAAKALHNLAASAEENKWAIVAAGVVQSIKELAMVMPVSIQIEMVHCINALSHTGMDYPFNYFSSHSSLAELKGRLLEMGISEVLVLLADSTNPEVRRESSTALQNLKRQASIPRWLLRIRGLGRA